MDYCEALGPEQVLTEGSLREMVEGFGLAVMRIESKGWEVVVRARMRDQFAERAAKALDHIDYYRPCGVRVMIEAGTDGPYR